MKRFAVIDNGVVTNLIVSDSKEQAESVVGFLCVELNESDFVNIGHNYDIENHVFSLPEPEPIEEVITE